MARAGISRDRILLTEIRSVEWQSLTFVGERHSIELRVPGPEAHLLTARLLDGLDEAEFSIPGQIVADIALLGAPVRSGDGSLSLSIEALTIAE